MFLYNRVCGKFNEITNRILLFFRSNFYNKYSREDIIKKFHELGGFDVDKSLEILLENGYIKLIEEKYQYDFRLSEKTLEEIKDCTYRIYHVY
jgi:hypothetical protein